MLKSGWFMHFNISGYGFFFNRFVNKRHFSQFGNINYFCLSCICQSFFAQGAGSDKKIGIRCCKDFSGIGSNAFPFFLAEHYVSEASSAAKCILIIITGHFKPGQMHQHLLRFLIYAGISSKVAGCMVCYAIMKEVHSYQVFINNFTDELGMVHHFCIQIVTFPA